MVLRRLALLFAVLLLSGAGKPEEPRSTSRGGSAGGSDLDGASTLPTIEDLGYFLGKLSEFEKSAALNVLTDLAADSRLPRSEVAQVLRRLFDEGSPPEDLGYKCPTCFQKRLSELLSGLRLRGPQVAGPQIGVLVLPINDSLLARIDKRSKDTFGASVPAFVQAVLGGLKPVGVWSSWAYARYHARDAEVLTEPVFFTSQAALAEYEKGLGEPLDAWNLARWLCVDPPRTRFDPGFLVLTFDVARTCKAVHIPTAGDCESPEFRPSPQSEQEAGRTCGGAPEWVCPNFPLSAATEARFVANDSYVRGLSGR